MQNCKLLKSVLLLLTDDEWTLFTKRTSKHPNYAEGFVVPKHSTHTTSNNLEKVVKSETSPAHPFAGHSHKRGERLVCNSTDSRLTTCTSTDGDCITYTNGRMSVSRGSPKSISLCRWDEPCVYVQFLTTHDTGSPQFIREMGEYTT